MNTQEKIARLEGMANAIENIIRTLPSSAAKKSPMNYELEALRAAIVSLCISPEPKPEKLPIRDAIRLIENSTGRVDEACKIAVAAMRKQEPVKPRYGGGAWRCPACAMAVSYWGGYCGCCGQKLAIPYKEG